MQKSLADSQAEVAAAKKTVSEQAAKLEAAAAVQNAAADEKPAPGDSDAPAPEAPAKAEDSSDKTAKTEEQAEVKTLS